VFYVDIILAIANLICLIGGITMLAYTARRSGTTIEVLYRTSAVIMYEFRMTNWVYLGGCIAYIALGIAALAFGMTYFGLSMLVTAAISSYSTAYFFSLHRQIARGIRII
jgi:hypothetical protein